MDRQERFPSAKTASEKDQIIVVTVMTERLFGEGKVGHAA